MDFTYGGLFPFLNIGAEYRIDRNGYYKAKRFTGMNCFLMSEFPFR